MSQVISFSVTDHSVTYFDASLVSRTIDDTHANFGKIRELLLAGRATFALLDGLLNLKTAVTKFGAGLVRIEGDTVYFKDQPLHTELTRRMLDIMRAGGDVTPLANFQERLARNPSKQAVDELFLWIEQSGLPILADGRFVAYKKVNSDYTSFHRAPGGGLVYNRIGDKPTMERNEVDDRREHTCSTGLHFCSFSYLPKYYGGRGRVMVLAVCPSEVVSIPSDYNNAKGRAFTYEIIGEVEGGEGGAAHRFEGTPVINGDLTAYKPEPAADDAEVGEKAVVDPEYFIVRTRGGVEFTMQEIFDAVEQEEGIRPAARYLGVAESSIRTWIAAYEAAEEAGLDATAEEIPVDRDY